MFLVKVMMEDMPIIVEQYLFSDEDKAENKALSLVLGGEYKENVVIARIEAEDAEDGPSPGRPSFTASELLSLHEIACRFDKSKPGYVDVEDIEPIKEKIKEWFKRVAPGRELR
jgi:hypothetical protein